MNGNASTDTDPQMSAICFKTTVSIGCQLDLSAHSPKKGKLRRQSQLFRGKICHLHSKATLSSVAENISNSQLLGICHDQYKSLCKKFLNKGLAQVVKNEVDLRDCSKKGMRYLEKFKVWFLLCIFFYVLMPIILCKMYCNCPQVGT